MNFEYEKPSMKFYDFQVEEIMAVDGVDGLTRDGGTVNLGSVGVNGPGHNNGEADSDIYD